MQFDPTTARARIATASAPRKPYLPEGEHEVMVYNVGPGHRPGVTVVHFENEEGRGHDSIHANRPDKFIRGWLAALPENVETWTPLIGIRVRVLVVRPDGEFEVTCLGPA